MLSILFFPPTFGKLLLLIIWKFGESKFSLKIIFSSLMLIESLDFLSLIILIFLLSSIILIFLLIILLLSFEILTLSSLLVFCKKEIKFFLGFLNGWFLLLSDIIILCFLLLLEMFLISVSFSFFLLIESVYLSLFVVDILSPFSFSFC